MAEKREPLVLPLEEMLDINVSEFDDAEEIIADTAIQLTINRRKALIMDVIKQSIKQGLNDVLIQPAWEMWDSEEKNDLTKWLEKLGYKVSKESSRGSNVYSIRW